MVRPKIPSRFDAPRVWQPAAAGLSWLFAGLLVLAVVACGGGSPDGQDSSDPSQLDGQLSVRSDQGGRVLVSAVDSPIRGAMVEIPADSLADDTEVITIGYEDALPMQLNKDALALGGQQISKVLVLHRTGKQDFGDAVRVTLPFDKRALKPDAVPIVVFWDDSIGGYSPITIDSLDRNNGTVTFMTAHFSRFVMVVLDKLFDTSLDPAALNFGLDFAPSVDGFFVHNFGSYDSPGGNCFGMAGYSAWYHAAKKSTRQAGLASLYKEGNPTQEEDDQTVRELITRAFQAGAQKGHLRALQLVQLNGLARGVSDRITGYTIFSQLVVTQQAQILAMGVSSLTGVFKSGHAVTVYAYDSANKVFKFYDNNYPGEVVEVSWDPVAGFGKYSKSVDWNLFAFASFNQAYSPGTLEALYTGAESGWAESHFPKIALSEPIESRTTLNTFDVGSDENVKIVGTVPRAPNAENPSAQRFVHVYINGIASGNVVPVANEDDKFEIVIPKVPNTSGTDVMLLVSESAKNWRGVFTSFKQFQVRVANQFFFENLGFESGDFAGWSSERRLWNGGATVTPSDKSTVIGTGMFDAHATDLSTVLFGKWSARINSGDGNYHISTLTQAAVVPSSKNPVIRFYWAAVLEDPQHPANEQPYIEVTVVNQTRGEVIYEKRHYSNDPTYSGWKSYQGGQWKSIPWQLVELPVASYIGDTLVLKVEAADCARGGHGGYAYLDVEE